MDTEMWEKQLEFYDALIATVPGLKRKGNKAPTTTANGYMFSQLNKAGEIGIRLPKEIGKTFIEVHNTGPFKSYGAVMKDYVLIPTHLYTNIPLLTATLKQAHEYVLSLPPK